MALSEDLRERVVRAVVDEGMSRNAAARRFGVGIASAVRWVRAAESLNHTKSDLEIPRDSIRSETAL